MADNRRITPGAARLSDVPPASQVLPRATTRVLLSTADYAELMRELDELRSRHRSELAQRLRDARGSGSPGDDDRLTVFEDAAIDQRESCSSSGSHSRLLSSTSTPAAPRWSGSAQPCWSPTRRVRRWSTSLVGRRGGDSAPQEVSLASPVGKALVGARPGDFARVALPSGCDRVLRVIKVTGGLLAAENAPPDAAVEAA